jgi:membrane protein
MAQETESTAEARTRRRERVLRTLTFWLRPHFVLRVINRFQKIAGFDRAIALASSALTAIIPLTILISAISSRLGGKDVADRLIDRYELTGEGAEAVKDIFAPSTGPSTSIGVLGFFFLMIAVRSFTRAMQRLFEQTWELKPLSVRNTVNGLVWIGGLTLFAGVTGFIHGLLGGSRLEIGPTLIVLPLEAAFCVWSGQILSAKRLSVVQLLPFGILAAVATAIYSIGASVYVPHLFNVYATRYGVIGAVFAMISTLFCVMVILAGSAAAGREIREELDHIKRGERLADDEVRHQWDEVTAEARSRWEVVRARAQRSK